MNFKRTAPALLAGLLLVAGPVGADTILADFESGAPDLKGLTVAGPGEGACAGFTGQTSRALCGASTVSGDVPAVLSFPGISLDAASALRFDIAAEDPESRFDGLDETDHGYADFLRIVGGAGGTLLGEFSKDPDSPQHLASTGAGLLAAGVKVGPAFSTVTIPGLSGQGLGTGPLSFIINVTGSKEFIGLDNIALSPATAERVSSAPLASTPLPGSLGLVLAGAAALALATRRPRAI